MEGHGDTEGHSDTEGHGEAEDPQRRARDLALAAWVPAELPLWAVCTLDELVPLDPWWEWASAELWGRPEIVAARRAHADRRQQLHRSLADVLGATHAAVFMSHLAPAPWSVLFAAGMRRPLLRADERRSHRS